MKKMILILTSIYALNVFAQATEKIPKTFGHRDFKTTFRVRHLKQCEFDKKLKNVVPKGVLVKEQLYLDNKEYYDDLTKTYGALIGQGYTGPVYIKHIGEPFGYGVFAQKVIKSGAMIGEYTGIVCPIASVTDAKYAFDYPAVHIGDTVHDGLVIDAYKAGNVTRFVNHSKDNANVYVETIPYKNSWHQVFIATRDIEPGEQLLIDYGDDYWKALEIVPEPITP